MKTIKPKPKSKKSSGRFARVKFANKEPVENAPPDLSQLRKPIDISVSSLLQVTKLLEVGGDEMKAMLAYECDVIYECRICRSLFRSLANFVSHKRVYCREKFNVSLCRKSYDDHIITEGAFVADPELEEDGRCKEDENIRILRSQAIRSASKKDLTSVVDMLQRKRGEDINENILESNFGFRRSSSVSRRTRQKARAQCEKVEQRILLEPIDTSKTAVYQTATEQIPSAVVQATDLMKTQMIELQNMIGRNTAVLNPDGQSVDAVDQLEKSDSPLQIYGSEDEDAANADADCAKNLVCTVCNAKFATRKTLTYHMKSLHVSYRTCYPCPCCSSTFANTWSVYRHLYKVHRKTNEQVRKLRAQIQEKAFRKETTGAEDIEKENAMMKSLGSGPERETINDTQEWMEHFELDLELQRCGGCGRRFDRRAALISHSQSCQKRIAACNEATSVNNSRGKRSAKVSPAVVNAPAVSDVSAKKTVNIVPRNGQSSRKGIPEKSSAANSHEDSVDASDIVDAEIPAAMNGNGETSIRVENVSRITNDDWERIDSNAEKSPTREKASPTAEQSAVKKDEAIAIDEGSLPETRSQSDAPEIIFTSIDESRTVAISFGTKKRRVSLINEAKDTPPIAISVSAEVENSTSAGSSGRGEKGTSNAEHVAIMENRIATIANLRKLQCLPCRRKFTSMTNLRRHMAIHIGWNRYRCKLCDFKCFVKCDCVAHCNKMHDAQNNRAIIADMVMQIPPDQNALSQEIIMDISSSYETSPEPEVIEVAAPTPKIADVAATARNSNDAASPRDKPDESKSKTTSPSKPLENGKPAGGSSQREKLTKRKEEDVKHSPVSERKQSRDDASENSAKQEDQTTRHGTQSKLDNDPDLRKMVMEVIFGTAETETPVPTPKVNGAKDVATANPSSKTGSSGSIEARDVRPQRPTRNRVKPVNEDFIYDLTELLRKESAIHRAAVMTTQKTLKKKQSSQQQSAVVGDNECSDENRSDSSATENQKLPSACKLPALLSCKKSESNSYTSKFSLRQAEIKLHPATNGIAALTSVIGSTNIPVSGQK